MVVEGLYSIGGDVAPLAEIAAVCQEAGAFLVVDEAHSFGAYGERGLGCAEAQGVLADVDFVVGTFSKTLAGVGGFCVSNHGALKALHFTARSYVFTASGSPLRSPCWIDAFSATDSAIASERCSDWRSSS